MHGHTMPDSGRIKGRVEAPTAAGASAAVALTAAVPGTVAAVANADPHEMMPSSDVIT